MGDFVNQPIKRAEDIFKEIVWDNFVTAALVSLKINVWPLNSIVRIITDKFYEFFRTSFDIQTIAFLNSVHKAEFEKAVITLKVIGADYGPESENYKNAKENAKNALSKFVRYSATT